MIARRVRLGQQYQDVDPRRGERIGTVIHVGHVVVKIRWNRSGYTTTVRRRDLESGEGSSRGYVLVLDVPGPPKQSKPPRNRAMTEIDADGVRWWICSVCRAKGRLRSPWWVLLYNDPLQPKSVVVCSDQCLRRSRLDHAEAMKPCTNSPPQRSSHRPGRP